MNQIKKIINQFEKVSLADLDRVELMNRMDLKFCLHIDLVPNVFQALKIIIQLSKSTGNQYSTITIHITIRLITRCICGTTTVS